MAKLNDSNGLTEGSSYRGNKLFDAFLNLIKLPETLIRLNLAKYVQIGPYFLY